jgi:hypothetical protein
MSTKVSVRKCKVCTKANPKEHWRKLTEYSLEKVTYNKHSLQLELNDTLCNSCYCMYDMNKKYKRTTKRKKNYDTAYCVKNQILLEIDEYIQLLDSIARVYELEVVANTIRLISNINLLIFLQWLSFKF